MCNNYFIQMQLNFIIIVLYFSDIILVDVKSADKNRKEICVFEVW